MTTPSAGGRWAHSSALRTEILWKHVEIGGSWDFASTASTGVEQTRPVMALVASNWTFSSLLVEVADSQDVQAVAAYSSMLHTIVM